MLSFTPSFLASPTRSCSTPVSGTTCNLRSSEPPSALDNVSPAVKLNAVAEALARRRDYTGAIGVLKEMSTAGITLDPPALSAIIDSAVLAPTVLATMLRTIAPPGFASHILPSTILSEPHSIDPDRPGDLSLAVSFLVLVTGAVSAELLEPPLVHHSADEATSMLLLLFAGLLFDRYAASAVTWQRISAGLARIFTDDPVRTARVDAAYFLVAYVLGLPWMCFRPDVKQIMKFHRHSAGEKTSGGVQAIGDMSDTEIDVYLVWLVAGVAFEDEEDGKLIESGLNSARTLVRTTSNVRRKRDGAAGHRDKITSEERIQAAITHAKNILRQNHLTHSKVTERMLKGCSVGECLIAVTDAFK